jgi:hypothetical protein
MQMILGFAFLGALIGLIPGGHFILIPIEVFLFYLIVKKHNALHVPTFAAVAVGLIGASTFLAGMVTFLQAIPIIGQTIGEAVSAIVAFAFIFIFGTLADHHYAYRPKA